MPKDYAAAVAWWRQAARRGDVEAEYNMGHAYANGIGVLKDYKVAAQWWQKAANKGYAPAMTKLGFLYRLGQGVKKDTIKSYVWFNLAAARFPPGTERQIAAGNRDEIASRLTSGQLEKANRMSTKWRAADDG